MILSNNNRILKFFLTYLPIILLFTSVLNEFDFNHLGTKYFSFNFSYILIFYYSLKRTKSLGYGLIFIAGLFNDVVGGTMIGISSLNFLLICGFSAYLRNITLRPSLIKDWIFFLVTVLVINSLSYILMTFTFDSEMNYFDIIVNTLFTFLLYFVFSFLFVFFEEKFIGRQE
jgi:rod shape-determining protein MreD